MARRGGAHLVFFAADHSKDRRWGYRRFSLWGRRHRYGAPLQAAATAPQRVRSSQPDPEVSLEHWLHPAEPPSRLRRTRTGGSGPPHRLSGPPCGQGPSKN
ncbi:hypothetical protein NDU88_004962 [Pleurodeles waltl]|uniref:Uncharacterized protein n=1 Tax=Pleurodeles waltl TaxID=8319 RepID=A0AAV7VK61_PLEWA|nr:hypothetical protein NDU88_004962 [Pleurodeles waltl]